MKNLGCIVSLILSFSVFADPTPTQKQMSSDESKIFLKISDDFEDCVAINYKDIDPGICEDEFYKFAEVAPVKTLKSVFLKGKERYLDGIDNEGPLTYKDFLELVD